MLTANVITEFEILEKELDMLWEAIGRLPNVSRNDLNAEAEELARCIETQIRLVMGTAHRVGALVENAVTSGAEIGREQTAPDATTSHRQELPVLSDPSTEDVLWRVPAAIDELDKMLQDMDPVLEMVSNLHGMSEDENCDEEDGLLGLIETQMRLIAGTAHRVKALVNHVLPIEEVILEDSVPDKDA